MIDCDVAALIDAQLEAYNRHDVPAFVETYAPSASLFMNRGEPWVTGHDAITREYSAFFEQAPELRAEVVNRIIVGDTVVDHERVRIAPNVPEIEAVAVYTVRECKIARVDFYPAQEPSR
jgi:uncharacterized protein (TIGR02246 family)